MPKICLMQLKYIKKSQDGNNNNNNGIQFDFVKDDKNTVLASDTVSIISENIDDFSSSSSQFCTENKNKDIFQAESNNELSQHLDGNNNNNNGIQFDFVKDDKNTVFASDTVSIISENIDDFSSSSSQFCTENKNKDIFQAESNNELSQHLNNFDVSMNRELNIEIENNESYRSTDNVHANSSEIEYLPFDFDEIERIYVEEQDMLGYATEYKISDHLDTVLSFEPVSRSPEIERHNHSDANNFSLSPILLRQRKEHLSVDHNLSSSKSIEATVDQSSLSITDNHFDLINNTDDDFDPSNFKNSTIVSTECSDEQRLPNIDDLANTSSENQNNCSKLPIIPNINSNPLIPSLSYTRKGSCNNTNLKVQTADAPRWKKKYSCPYCHKLVCKLPRHLETVHGKDVKGRKDAEDDNIKKLKDSVKGTAERKEILTIMRNQGSLVHNSNPLYNDGILLVSRRPKTERPATDYITCPNCLITLVKTHSRRHISKCIPGNAEGSRNYLVLGRTVEGRLHETASDTLRLVVFPVLREDDLVRQIRYDWLIILYGNKLCLKYTPHYQHNMIRARLRLIGRFLCAAKAINSEITELANIYHPKYVTTVIDAIKAVAEINQLKNTCETPAVAQNLVTYIKQIGLFLETEYVIKGNEDGQKQVMNFLKVHKTEMPISINKVALEADAKMRRQKVEILPMTGDINKLLLYLKDERRKCFKELLKEYEFSEWLKGLKLVAVYLLVFNRRRVGDIQNILKTDFEHLEDIDMTADKEEFNALDEQGKQIAQSYKRIRIRGKRGRIVSVILSTQVIHEITILMQNRQKANVSLHNEYLFGLPNPLNSRIRIVNLCLEMRKISALCGADKPELLRGTGLRKHIATKCIELELKDSEVAGVAGHLGHSERIHQENYRMPPKSRTIIQITKILQAVQGDYDEENNFDSKDNDADNQSEFLEYDNENLLGTSNNITNEESTCYVSENDNEESTSKTYDNKKEKKRWNESEKNVVRTAFAEDFAKKTLPSLQKIDELKTQYPCLKDRPRQSIKTWISNQFKIPSTPQALGPRIISCKKVNFTFKKAKN